MYHLWMIKYSAISMDVNVSSIDDQVQCTLLSVWIKYSAISMCYLWMIKYSAISMDANVSSMDDQVLCYQYGCQCVIYR